MERGGTYSTWISRYVYFLLKKKMVKFLVKSLKNKVPLISSGELEVSLSMIFSCKEKWEINTVMEEFVEYFCSFEQSDNLHWTYDTNNWWRGSNDSQTITLDQPEQMNLEIKKKLDKKICNWWRIVCIVSLFLKKASFRNKSFNISFRIP